MSQDATQVFSSSTYLFDAEFVEEEDRIYTTIWSEDGSIVTEGNSKRVIFFNLEQDEEFDKRVIVFRPEAHRIGREGNKDYVTVDEVLYEFNHELIDEVPKLGDEGKSNDIDPGEDRNNEDLDSGEDETNESLDSDEEETDEGSTDPFETEEVDQNVGDTRIVSTTSTDKDLLNDLDVHKF